MNHSGRLLFTLTGSIALAVGCTVSLAEERQWTYQYNSNGQITLADGPRVDADDSIHYGYDASGNRISAANSLGYTSHLLDHNERGQPRRIIDVNGVETRLTYHPRGWITSRTVIDPTGDSSLDAITDYSYDSEGMLLSTTLPDGSTLSNEYDGARRLVAVSNNLGERVEYTLDEAGNRIAERSFDTNGTLLRDINRSYDELKRLITITGASGQTTHYTYDRNGNRTSRTDGNGNTTVQWIDSLDRIYSTEAAYAHTVHYNHDQRDNLTAVTDPRGLATNYTINGFDEVVTLDSPDTGVSSYHYDSAGNRILSTDARGISVASSYDALNRQLESSYPDTSLNISYGYDGGSFGIGRLTTVSDASGTTTMDYDHRGNLVFEARNSAGHDFNLAYEYNLADRVTRITYPSGRTVDYSYDGAGRQMAIHSNGPEGARTIASDAGYLPFGPVTSLVLGNGMQMQAAYDLDYRLTTLSFGSALNRSYSYDSADNITAINDQKNATFSQALGYDALNRLGNASGGYGNLSYSYDANSNRLSHSSSNGTDVYSYASNSNRLQSTSDWQYQYDTNGNLVAKSDNNGDNTTIYQYDARNRLARVIERRLTNGEPADSLIAEYSYNFRNQRTRKQTADEDIHYVYGQRGELLAEINGDGIPLREYIYFNERPIAVASTSFTYGPAEPGPETLLDDTSAGTSSSGTWEQVRKKGAWGDYYHLSEDAGNSYRWHPGTLQERDYEIYAWWPKVRKNNPSATYRIHHGGQVSTVTANQGRQGKQWVYLGTYSFSGNGDEYIDLSDAGGKTAADGIRLVEILPPPPPLISTEIYYIHTDHLGTPQTLTNQAQNVVWNANYRPFGQADIDVAAITNNLRFPGQYFDAETGLHQNYFRDYDSSWGRYIETDPLGIEGGINTYSYSNNNPFTYLDPFGLAPSWVGPTAIVISTTGGALALHPNPITPPLVRATGLVMVGVGGALEVWDWATALDEVKASTSQDIQDIQKNIEKINDLIKSQDMLCE
ncbi:hypothetical protein DWB85_15670 [Seongchinamella sediminis]|uniref:RHS repeat-associated core domain-containing protein n=1 Tax=Seongchinamella sediminis TaxID=2283635 RepID=A0A3L7DX61_9GAMM|nr:RHS repeat-associated core domain-containing protein [Seongchinamella sediminis]RLQ20833.1 hypothetical protein DWB85_15670 [Seongchinamella sediminis]